MSLQAGGGGAGDLQIVGFDDGDGAGFVEGADGFEFGPIDGGGLAGRARGGRGRSRLILRS